MIRVVLDIGRMCDAIDFNVIVRVNASKPLNNNSVELMAQRTGYNLIQLYSSRD